MKSKVDFFLKGKEGDQMKFLKEKVIISEMKFSVDGINSRLEFRRED